MTKKCTWTETNGGECWNTACGCEIDDTARLEIIGSYNAEFCPWCGGRILEETMAERRAVAADDFAHLDGIRARKLDEDRGLA